MTKPFTIGFKQLMQAFKRFAYPFKEICTCLTLQRKRLNGLLICLKKIGICLTL